MIVELERSSLGLGRSHDFLQAVSEACEVGDVEEVITGGLDVVKKGRVNGIRNSQNLSHIEVATEDLGMQIRGDPLPPGVFVGVGVKFLNQTITSVKKQ